MYSTAIQNLIRLCLFLRSFKMLNIITGQTMVPQLSALFIMEPLSLPNQREPCKVEKIVLVPHANKSILLRILYNENHHKNQLTPPPVEPENGNHQHRKKKLPLLIAMRSIHCLTKAPLLFPNAFKWNHHMEPQYKTQYVETIIWNHQLNSIICVYLRNFRPSSLKRLFPPSLKFRSSQRSFHPLLILQVVSTSLKLRLLLVSLRCRSCLLAPCNETHKKP